MRIASDVRFFRNSSADSFEMTAFFTSDPPPQLGDTLQRMMPIRPSSGVVSGLFDGFLAVQDSELSTEIRYAPFFTGQSAADRNAGFLDTDQIPAGLWVPGPFERLAVTSGMILGRLV